MIDKLLPLATGRVILGLLAGVLLINLIVIPWAVDALEAIAGADSAPPDIRFWMTSGEMNDLWERYGTEGRAFYVQLTFTMDLAYPLIYGFFFALLLLWISKKGNFHDKFWKQATWMPLLAMLVDFAENAVNATMALSFPSYPQGFLFLSNILGAVKFLCIVFSLGLVVLYLGKWGGHMLQKRRKND